MKNKETNYSPSYEELEILEKCYDFIKLVKKLHPFENDVNNFLQMKSSGLTQDLSNVIKSLHHKHMDYSLRNVKLNKTK